MAQLLTPIELSQQLGVAEGTIYNWCHKKKIPYVKVGKLLRFNQDRIDNWITSRTVKNRS